MIEIVSHNSGTSPAADPTQKPASAKTLYHTPFGDVMVNEISTTRLTGTSPGGRSSAKSAPAAAKAAVATSTAQAAVAPAAAKAALAMSATQAAAPAPVAAPAVQAAEAADAPAPNSVPTAESVFGPNPWMTNPTFTAPNGSSYGYNPMYFATAATAAQVAQMMGGKVVAGDQLASAGGFAQQQPNEMVQLPNGTLVNAGLVAAFYTHGYPQSFIDTEIQNEIQGT